MSNQTQIVLDGYLSEQGEENHHMYSSTNWLLFEVGKHMADEGYDHPHSARIGRGYTVIVDGRTFEWVDDTDPAQFILV